MSAHKDLQNGLFAIRLAEPGDLDGFMSLAALTGPGFTSLPAHEGKMTAILAASQDAAQGAPGAVMLAMEDEATGKLAGCAAVKRGGVKRKGFANFQIARDSAGAVRSLSITDAYSDLTEIGGLFVHPDYRSKGVGKALAQSRYLYLATAPESFGGRVFAELRGVIDEDGVSPFYESACRPSLGMDFTEADRLCDHGENDRLVAMLPQAPIPTENFSPAAMAALGACHDSGKAARAMLEKEGFAFEGVVDLLDGGALMAAETTSLTSLKQSRMVRVKSPPPDAATEHMLFSTLRPDSFRCVAAPGFLSDNLALCGQNVLHALKARDNDLIRVSPLRSGRAGERPVVDKVLQNQHQSN